MAAQVTPVRARHGQREGAAGHPPKSCPFVEFTDALRWAGMAYDVARVRGLHPSLGDGWVHFDAQNGMLLARLRGQSGVDRIPRVDADARGTASVGATQRRGAGGCAPGGRRSGQRRSAGRGARRRPRGLADVAGRRVVVAGRSRLRDGGDPARRRGEHRTVAARRESLWRQGEVGRGRHRDR